MTTERDARQVPAAMPLRFDGETNNLVNADGVALARFRHRSQGEAVAHLCNSHSALVAENERLREGASQAHKLLGALRGIDMQNASVRDSVGAAFVHLDAALTTKAST